jgi:hypothetical protein
MLTAGPAARSGSLDVCCRGETTRGHKGRSTANHVGDPGGSRGRIDFWHPIAAPQLPPEGVTGYYARTAWLLDLCRDGGRIIGDESPSRLSHNHWARRMGGRYGHTQPSIRARLPHRGSIAQDRLTDAPARVSAEQINTRSPPQVGSHQNTPGLPLLYCPSPEVRPPCGRSRARLPISQ